MSAKESKASWKSKYVAECVLYTIRSLHFDKEVYSMKEMERVERAAKKVQKVCLQELSR